MSSGKPMPPIILFSPYAQLIRPRPGGPLSEIAEGVDDADDHINRGSTYDHVDDDF
jgi:hypothetical protein